MADQGNKTSTTTKTTDTAKGLVLESKPLSGFLGETTILGNDVGLHMTTRGVIGAGYVALGVGLAIVGLVFVVGGLSETKSLVRSVSKGFIK